MQGVQWMKVVLEEHSEEWEREYRREEALLRDVMGGNILDIQHVGSTSVRGICAKPILDIAVLLRDIDATDLPKMEKAGFRYMGARNEKDSRRLFIRYVERDGVRDIALTHVHCYRVQAEEEFRQLVCFRDYLNRHPQEAMRYDRIKRELAKAHGDDRFAYSDGKRAFIERINSIISRERNG